MTFTTTTFILLFLPFLFAGILLFHKKKTLAYKLLVLLSSLVFYLWAGKKTFACLLIYSAVVYLFIKILNVRKLQAYRSKVAVIEFIFLLVPLFFVKYAQKIFPDLNVFFPLGISFFSFQAVSLVMDESRNQISDRYNYFNVLSYLTFFPTVVSGPILRFNQFNDGFCRNNVSVENVNEGIKKFIFGLAKKMLVANKVAVVADYYFDCLNNGVMSSTLGLWVGAIAYSLQLYFDFSGYSDMAIGIGKIMGFDLPENFNYPYVAKSISDFWKRWHISLTQWFRDYIYFPLGGNRCSVPRHIFNMLVVWLFTGIWHGSSMNYVLWGLLYFMVLILEKYCRPFNRFISEKKVVGHIYSSLVIILLWVVFRSSSLSLAVTYLSALFGLNSASVPVESYTLRMIPFLIFCIIVSLPVKKCFARFEETAAYRILETIFLVVVFVLSFSTVLNSSFVPFIYGNF